MTLDPVHVDSIADLAAYLASRVDDTDHVDVASRIWEGFLDPLYGPDGRAVLEPIGERRLRAVDAEDVALASPPFETVHGLDSGTINPTTFKNGLVLDLAQAAMAAVPSDLDLHRHRSIVAATHVTDETAAIDEPWRKVDEGYCRWRVLQIPRVNRYAEGIVHALALYLAESSHALEHADEVSDLLVLDGPLYPVELLNWRERDAELRALTEELKPRSIVENYIRLVESFVERDVPLCGFVKNPASKRIVGTLREGDVEFDVPWADDAAFFARLLERREQRGGVADGEPTQGVEGRKTDELTFTNWFVSRGGVDATVAADGDAYGIERELDPTLYEKCFFVVYEPRTDVCYRVETPYAFARDAEVRESITRQILGDVAANRGPPEAVAKADELAKISAREKSSLRQKFAETLDTDEIKRYDDVRWGDVDQ
ncbi:DNA double-strand break repair nuclease NurA [Halobellus limi]|uniref:Nuclease n=1 Tax=Halobellus limi TaxID=699433 RepID=A0A1H5TE29_9EURY|nr:DNA double-strand break repair nuclease NurA [Halobellus limi]QCC47334.1 nuclease [Halobellus limi]SEF61024.1 NurA domain-containing protein [Halobellus limi]